MHTTTHDLFRSAEDSHLHCIVVVNVVVLFILSSKKQKHLFMDDADTRRGLSTSN